MAPLISIHATMPPFTTKTTDNAEISLHCLRSVLLWRFGSHRTWTGITTPSFSAWISFRIFWQEKCLNCKGNHIAFSSRCGKNAEATRVAKKRRRREPAGWTTNNAEPTSEVHTTWLALRVRVPEVAQTCRSEKEMANTDEPVTEAENFTMMKSTVPRATARPAPPATGTPMVACAGIECKNRTGVAALPECLNRYSTTAPGHRYGAWPHWRWGWKVRRMWCVYKNHQGKELEAESATRHTTMGKGWGCGRRSSREAVLQQTNKSTWARTHAMR